MPVITLTGSQLVLPGFEEQQEGDEVLARGEVRFDGTHFVATIDDWWMATGVTQEEACRKVVAAWKVEDGYE